MFLVYLELSRVDKRKTEKFRGDPKVVQSVPEGVLEQRGIK
jgi:hypothetical protein